ncbi:DnaJ domain-containing protein [Flammeovirga sp. SubArs3]|uniref:J domain-containing protein n=1 Tax=Flammeovirga sp. SubArs3 TaxID=2995316 RepID=UPI00248C4CB7|nr:DnaJ domain-containing protein [Flammeovirga sp. SubArs3]
MISYYDILEIPENATKKEIKAAYKRMAKKYHPDKNQENDKASEVFKLVVNAYENLMNDYQRELYDNWLKYQQEIQTSSTEEEFEEEDTEPIISTVQQQKEEDKEILKWASVGAAVFFVIVLSSIFANQYIKHKNIQEQLESEQKAISTVLNYSEKGQYGKALIAARNIENTLQILSDRGDILYDSLMQEVDDASLYFFQNKEYYQVIRLLEEVEKEIGKGMPQELYWRLAVSQFNTQKYEKSIYTFNQLIEKNKFDFKAHMGLAEVYSTGLNEPENAINVLSGAALLTNDYYKDTYGGAYAVVLEAKDVPEDHFSIYILRARLLRTLGRHEEVVRDCRWASRLRPEDYRAYYMLGESLLALGRNGEACSAFEDASNLGHMASSIRKDEICMK